MPIKGLTDREERFPKIGSLHKGSKRKTATNERGEEYLTVGSDQDFFRFESDATTMELFEGLYGQEPREIDIYLPYRTTEQNFDAWKKEWVKSKKGNTKLKRKCDGENQVLWLKEDFKTYGTTPIPCLQNCDCKPQGTLSIVIPGLKRLGYIELSTTSKWDIMGISENLLAIEHSVGDLRGVPMILCRRLRKGVSTPFGNKDMWLLAIEAAPRFAAQLMAAVERQALPGSAEQLSLGSASEVSSELSEVLVGKPKEKVVDYGELVRQTAQLTGHTSREIRELASQALGRSIASGADIRGYDECVLVQQKLMQDAAAKASAPKEEAIEAAVVCVEPSPNNEAIVERIRLLTGHQSATIVNWCKERDIDSPARLDSELLEELLLTMTLSWAKGKFESDQLAMNSYRGKISVLTAGGASLADAIASWIESVQAPVGGRNG